MAMVLWLLVVDVQFGVPKQPEAAANTNVHDIVACQARHTIKSSPRQQRGGGGKGGSKTSGSAMLRLRAHMWACARAFVRVCVKLAYMQQTSG